ncbi:putative RNA polymerase II transcription factor B subunit 1-1 [Tanacetum coccineum]|uniref:RNA polymerase II transcription factor B subunit 1-1 n=1 Tax=Tanacetum coccineum TaxID=301880 RepID=A0ABQ5GU58_9ASTR
MDAQQGPPKRVRGPTRKQAIWDFEPGKRFTVTFERGQPVGDEAKELTSFLGTLAKMSQHIDISITDWRKVSQDKKDDLWSIFKAKFEFAPVETKEIRLWVMSDIGKKWKTWKYELKKCQFDSSLTVYEIVAAQTDTRVEKEDFKNLVTHWFCEDAQGNPLPKKMFGVGLREPQPPQAIVIPVVEPPSQTDFIITGLLAFVSIKAQGDHGFPFHTHAKSVKLSLISLLFYGFASAAEVSVRHGNSTHRAIAYLGRIVSVGLLVGSLASAISEKKKIVHSKSYEPHALGTKSFARLADEEKKKTCVLPTRGTLYIMSRTKKNGSIVNATAAKVSKELLNDDSTSTSNTTNDVTTSTSNTTTGNGIVDWSNDDLARVKGKEKEDYTRCVGPNIRLPRQEMKENQAAILQFMAKYKNHNSNEDFSNVLNTRNTEVANDSSSVHNPGPYGNSTSTRANKVVTFPGASKKITHLSSAEMQLRKKFLEEDRQEGKTASGQLSPVQTLKTLKRVDVQLLRKFGIQFKGDPEQVRLQLPEAPFESSKSPSFQLSWDITTFRMPEPLGVLQFMRISRILP